MDAIVDPTVFEDLTCQEQSIHARDVSIPCGVPAVAIVWHARDNRAYLMCAPCADHNVLNRGGRLLVTAQPRGGR